MNEGTSINFRKRAYTESFEILSADAKELAAIAIQAVNFTGSGGFPAREPE